MVDTAAAGQPGEVPATPPATQEPAGEEVAAAEPSSTAGMGPVVEVEPAVRSGPPLSYETFIGPVSILGNSSGFYRNFYGTGQFSASYGLSVDAELLIHFPSLTFGADVSVDGHFANLTPSGGDHLAYKVSLNAGFPKWLSFPLFFRLGFMQQWYFFATDLPNVLITDFPSPTLGAMVKGLPLFGPVSLDVGIDLYAISLFTSYFSLGMDAAVALEWSIPLSDRLSLSPRLGVQPQMLFAFGTVEFQTKVEIGVGVVSHEP